MKRYYFTIVAILVLAIGITSCSNEETKTQNQIAARPTVPIQNGEVQIGTQIWMTKNLNVSRYRNGDLIPQVTNPVGKLDDRSLVLLRQQYSKRSGIR